GCLRDPRPQECALSCSAHLLPGPDRNRKEKGCAVSNPRFDPDSSAVHLDNMPRDRQSQSRSALFLRNRTVGLLKLFENPDLISWIDAWSGVTNEQRKFAVRRRM